MLAHQWKKLLACWCKHIKTFMVRKETSPLGMDHDKCQFSLEKLSRSHLSTMESSILKKWHFTYFYRWNLKKRQHPTLLQATSNLVVPTKYHGSYNEGCQKKSQHKNELPNQEENEHIVKHLFSFCCFLDFKARPQGSINNHNPLLFTVHIACNAPLQHLQHYHHEEKLRKCSSISNNE
jgi:hypothetical protein